MEKRLNQISVIQDILYDSKIGLWCFEADKGQPIRLYGDETFCKMMGMDPSTSPEERCSLWYEHISHGDMEKVRACVNEMIDGKYAEVQYSWFHPTRGMISVRCVGKRDDSYTDGVRLMGNNQDVSDIIQFWIEKEKEYESIEQANQTKQTILDTIPGGVGVIRCTAEGVWVPEFLSEGFAAMTGMSLDQAWTLYRQDAMTGVHPDDKEQVTLDLNNYFNGNEEYTELTYRLKRGEEGYLWVRNALNMTRNGNGDKRVYCVYHDMTMEMEEKEQLRQQYQEWLNQHYHSSGDDVLLAGHCNINKNKILEMVDRTQADLLNAFGYEREAFFMKLSSFIVDEEERASFRKTYSNASCVEAYAKGQTELVQSYFIRLPNEEHGRYVQFKVNLITEPDTDELTGILSVKDVTEQVTTKKLLQNLSNLGFDKIMDVDLYKDTITTLIFNGEDEAVYDKESFTAYKELYLQNYVLPESRELIAGMVDTDYIQKRLQETASYSFSYFIRNQKDDSVLAKKMTISAIDLRLGRVCFARTDITETLEAERRSKAALEEALKTAEQANRAKSEFLSNVSHDIRTPMNAIVGMTAIAMSNLEKPQQLKNCLSKIVLSSNHLLGLINNVLDMSKIESGKLTLNMDLVSLREMMEGIIATIQPQMKAKGQEFDVILKNVEAEEFYSDGIRLHQVLLNLLGNAVKFTPEGGKIQLCLFEEPSEKGARYVRLHFLVQDNGMGMTEEFQAHIFDSFAREDNLRVHKTEGSGLGMAITKYIIDALDGTIEVKSQVHQGTEFHVILDVERAVEREMDMVLPHWNMLLVDDDQTLCESATESLKEIGLNAEWTTSGKKAVAMVKERHEKDNDYQMVLLDWKMPEMNGIETARAIRESVGGNIPILVISAYDWSDIEEEARAVGIDGFIPKPLFKSTLFLHLRKYMEGADMLTEEINSDLEGMRILLAEDNPLNSEIAVELLSERGAQVDAVENGQLCVEKFIESAPGYYDAILMDIRMPVMNGYEATKKIRDLKRADTTLPIFAMTADAFAEDVQKSLAAGMNAHMSKPVDIEKVAQLLNEYRKK